LLEQVEWPEPSNLGKKKTEDLKEQKPGEISHTYLGVFEVVEPARVFPMANQTIEGTIVRQSLIKKAYPSSITSRPWKRKPRDKRLASINSNTKPKMVSTNNTFGGTIFNVQNFTKR
jgi:hypothetical protein